MNRDFSFWFYGTLLIAGFVSCVASAEQNKIGDFSFWFYETLLIAGFVSCVAYVAMSLV